MKWEQSDYASKGVAGAGLGTGIAGLSLGVLNALGGGLLGGNCNTQVQMAMSEKDSKIAELTAEKYTNGKVQELYNFFVAQNEKLSNFLCQQSAKNAVVENELANIKNIIGTITKVVVPNSAICPAWGEVTITPATTTTA